MHCNHANLRDLNRRTARQRYPP